jgi:putative transposase
MRKQYSAAFKARIIIELLQEAKSVPQIASEHGVHPNQLYRWKAQALKNLPRVFDAERDKQSDARHEQQLEQLYAEIGRLTTHVNWLKKKSGLDRAAN